MTSAEEWQSINARGADAFIFETYGADTVVTLGGFAMTLTEVQAQELVFRNLEELRNDPQDKRAGIWARLLDEAGVLRNEHADLLPLDGGYSR